MKIEFVLKEIEKEIEEIKDFTVHVIEDEDKVKTNNHVEYYALDIEVEDDDKEINVLTNQHMEDSLSDTDALTVMELYDKLKILLPQRAEYSMFSASSKNYIDKDYWTRLDVPLLTVGRDYEERKFALIQMKE